MKKILIFLILFTIFLFGCSSKTSKTNILVDDNKNKNISNEIQNENTSDNKNDDNIIIVDEEDSNIDEIENHENKDEKENESINETFRSPLSGLIGDKEKINRRPVAVMIDNHVAAKWQSGLSQAEIVYEILAEGTITRYMAIFLMNEPNLIGPIRSSRPYFIKKALEYDSIYAHCGGSEQAYDMLKKLKVDNLDEIRNAGYSFFRYYDTGKKAEHTLYSSMEKLRYGQKVHRYREEPEFISFNFYKEDTVIDGDDANEILIKYYKNNYTKYVYDVEKKEYIRYKKYREKDDLELHIDEYDGKIIKTKNIIIQRADTKIIDNYGRREIQLIGEGEGYFITNGKMIPVRWKKDSIKDKTRYYSLSGDEIKLNPGVTWIQVIQNSTKLEIK